ncbi:MAG: putative NTPase [Candidatus Aminicenantes bacterium]|nr:putative NTPase [Candidatus Aminicenantes bacterium]
MVLVLTGPVHGGKTTFLERALPGWASRGLHPCGFISPAVTDGSGERGYDLAEIGAGRRRPYLRRRGVPGAEQAGPYAFVPATLERARAIIRDADPSGLLVVDEVGPLELAGGGLWPALRDALRRQDRTTLLVVREEILAGLAAALAPLVPVVFDVRDAGDRQLLEERILTGIDTHDHQG